MSFQELTKTGGVLDINVPPEDKMAQDEVVDDEQEYQKEFKVAEGKAKKNFHVESKSPNSRPAEWAFQAGEVEGRRGGGGPGSREIPRHCRR